MIKNKVTLEVCPTSNVQTNAVDKYTDHPIKKLIDTINFSKILL